MAVFKEKMELSQEELNRYNDLLQLDFENWEENKHEFERLNATEDDYIEIKTIEFENGNYISISLASGANNYYDNIVLWNKDNFELASKGCTYKIDSFEFSYNDDIYIVEMEME